ncbi:MAG: DUF456 domain-containing protein [Caldilineaceae bacterium]
MTLTLLGGIGLAIIGLGLIGALLPLLPGAPLIWLGALMWAWSDNFVHIGWPTLTVLALLVLASWGFDLLLAPAMSRRAGVSWRAIGGAVVGGLLGGIFLSTVPIVGTLFGALVGAMLGMWFVEYRIRGDERAAFNAVRTYVSGVALSTFLNVLIAIGMIAIFYWQATGG